MASAKRKRNIKTHPRVRGENDADDGFMPPDRPDVIAASETADDATAEVIDLGGTRPGAVQVRGDKDDEAADDGETPPSQVERRGTAAEPAPPRRQEREDRAARRPARADANDDDRGDADDRRDYSKKVRARIARERAVVNRERALREQRDRELAEERTARQELAERITRIERTSTKVAADADVKALKSQIEAIAPQIAAAVEAGNTAQALTLQIKLGELQADLKVKEYDLTLRAQNAEIVTENERKQREAATAAAARARQGDQTPPEQKTRGNEFIRANRHWWRRDKDAQEAALAIDVDILADIKDGDLDFEPYSDEHFEELADRLHEDFPDIEICDLDREPYDFGDGERQDQDDRRGETRGNNRGARVDNRNQRQNARQNGNRPPPGRLGAPRQQLSDAEMARQGKVVLTEEDFKEMRIFKLDPNNPEHKKRFAQERARTILARESAADDQRGAR